MEIVPSNSAARSLSPVSSQQGTGMLNRIKQVFTKHLDKSSDEGKGQKQLRLTVAQRTDIGLKRQHNEDNVAYIVPKDARILTKKGALFIVADGMGGHAAGEVASEIAVRTVTTLYYQDNDSDVVECLLRAISYANTAIFQRAMEHIEHNGMGTTCVAAVLLGSTLYVTNIGDSRAYLVRSNAIRQISQDHSWVAEQVRAGAMSEEEAQMHEMRNMITRSLGSLPDVEIDMFVEKVEEGDTLILCSDGLCAMLDDSELLELIKQYTPQESVYRLIERANEYGGNDNITALVAQVSFIQEG